MFVVTVLAFVREGNNENPLENCAVGNLHEVRSDFGGFSVPEHGEGPGGAWAPQ